LIRLVYLSDNQLEGSIPSNFGQASLLRDLYLDGNQLTGTIPGLLQGQLPELNEFLLQHNNLVGAMPASICTLFHGPSGLQDLWADCVNELTCSCCTQCFA
jgi:hypothetical protein